ncbi:MmgE/PrpD family protein [Chloroflexota bacterium]
MDRILQFLSDYATDLTYEKLPPEVIHQVKRRTIDGLGCAMGAYMETPAKIARSLALEVTSNPGATVLGTHHHTSPELAAFANGVMVRYLDFNDTGMALEAGHPSDNIPPVLAAAEYAGTDGPTAITGIVLAYEVQGRFGEPVHFRSRGWDHTTCVAISAAAGAGKALGLTREQMANALALATTANISLIQLRMGTLSMWKGCAAGNASRNGVFAARLASRGLTGPGEVFEGRGGFLKQITGPIELPSFGGNGRMFKVQDAKFKYFPTDYEAQCAFHPALELREALGGRTDDIEKIIIHTYGVAVTAAADSPDKWDPTTRETADHSLPYVLAVAFTKGAIWLDDFTEESIRNPELRPLMKKIEVYEEEEYTKAFPEANCFRIEVITRSGERHVREIRYAKGHPKNPMTDQEIETKFRRLVEPVMGSSQTNSILDRIWHMEEVKEMREILTLFELKSGSKA